MKVKNEYVEIKIGNKTYRHQNMILNEYLYKLFNMQLDIGYNRCLINLCCIKLDTPIQNVDYDSEIPKSLFDITIINSNVEERNFLRFSERTDNSIKLNYFFNNACAFQVNGDIYESSDINKMFANRKITAIGFGNPSSDNIFAFLDTSNLNIVINYGEEISITRVDTIQSDGICNGLDYPLHLVNDTARKDREDIEVSPGLFEPYYTKAQLYSVGFGNIKGFMEEEYLISNLTTTRTDNSISFNLTRNKTIGKYPSNNLYTGFYPLKDNSKYLIFKYRLYKANYQGTDYYYLDEYYTMSMPNETFGDLNIKLKIERI